jgi:2',3'-cyclic-nucleotide 2'-phosphodiesterase (5'-nucleotidase family)
MRKSLVFLALLLGPAAGLWIAAQTPTHVVIMHTNDLHGQLLPRDGVGGIAEVAAVIRNGNPDLIIDAGDFSTGTFLADEFKGAPTIQAMNLIHFTASTLGNHDFDYGQDALRMRLREASFPLLSANVDSPVGAIKKYTAVTRKGIRFGLIGLTTEGLKIKSHPKLVENVTVLDIVKSFEKVLPEVRKKSDFIIATVHLEDDEEQRLASAFPEVRLIIGGHNHAALGPIRLGQTLVAKTGSNGQNVGRVDMDFQSKKLVRMDAKLIPVKGVRPDADVSKILEPFQEQVIIKMDEPVGEATTVLSFSRVAESPLADLVADAFREKMKTQIALHNVGGIRTSIRPGTIKWGDVFAVLPFQNTLVTLKLTGAQIKKTLERGLLNTVGMVAISGIRVQFDPKKPDGQKIASLLLIDGTPVDDSKLYSVTTNDFVVAGGDGFTEPAKGTDIQNTGLFLRDVLADYIKDRRTISPIVDGRIIMK